MICCIHTKMYQLNDIYKPVVEINDEMTEIDENYSEKLWFAKIDETVFSFKPKIHNWLREGENGTKEKRVSNLQVPDENLLSQAGHHDPDHQGCHPERKLCKKS